MLHHRVKSFFELENFAAHVHGDFTREIAAGDGGGHFSDVANLASKVAGHEVYVVREIFPGAAYVGHLRLASQLSFGADFASDTGNFRSKGVAAGRPSY